MPPAKRAVAAKRTAPVNAVDETVVNQENLGAGNVVDRNPDPQIVENSQTGASYDVSKSSPELVDPDREETEARRARLLQTDAVLNAKDFDRNEDSPKKVSVEFVQSGLTANGKVWKRGEVFEVEDSPAGRKPHEDLDGVVWYELSSEDQKNRYGRVFFEKR